MMHVGDIEWS